MQVKTVSHAPKKVHFALAYFDRDCHYLFSLVRQAHCC